jgi:hypothetical protein
MQKETQADSGIRVWICGEEDASFGRGLSERSGSRRDSEYERRLNGEVALVDLLRGEGSEDYLDRYAALMRSRAFVAPPEFRLMPGKGPGRWLLFAIRRFLWKLLRYQHDWMSFHQNTINTSLVYELEFELAERKRQIEELEQRVRRLEEALIRRGGDGR